MVKWKAFDNVTSQVFLCLSFSIIQSQLWIAQPILSMTHASVVARQPVHQQGQVHHVTLPARRPVDVRMVLSLMEGTV